MMLKNFLTSRWLEEWLYLSNLARIYSEKFLSGAHNFKKKSG